MATLRHLLISATRQLAPTSPTPRLDAELLLAHVLGWSRAQLLAESAHQPTVAQQTRFTELLRRRVALEPVAYLIGEREFFGLNLTVDQRVLVPRPETELLVEQALTHIQQHTPPITTNPPPLTLVDVGTGSGAIALALATHLPQALVYAIDTSAEALAVATTNRAKHGLSERVQLLQGDLLTPLPAPVDIIVSNPPYTLLPAIDVGVREHEPPVALDGGPDGLQMYRRLIAQAPAYLRPSPYNALLLEIGATQAAAVTALVAATFPTATIRVLRDLAGHDRVIYAQIA